jgi:hypothetical protein
MRDLTEAIQNGTSAFPDLNAVAGPRACTASPASRKPPRRARARMAVIITMLDKSVLVLPRQSRVCVAPSSDLS